MKPIATLLLFLLTIPATSQRMQITSYLDWLVVDESVIWQRVFEDKTITEQDIVRHLRGLSWVRDIETQEGTIYATAVNFTIDFKKHGGSSFDLPFIYQNGKWNWAIEINYKPGRYRVTISSLTFDAGAVEGSFIDIPVTGSIEGAVLKKGRQSFKQGQLNALDIFGADLLANFTVKKRSTANDDW